MEGPETRKKVDENWKAQVEREKGTSAPSRPRKGQEGAPEESSGATDFGLFLSSLSMQALIALGEVPHRETNTPQIDLEQARYFIDILGMLQAKTKGNLEPQEEQALEGVLYELRTKYVAKTKRAPG